MRAGNRISLIAIVLSVAASTTSLAAQEAGGGGAPPAGPPLIETSGHGEARVTPDRATVVLSVETKGPVAAAVAAANARVQRRVIDTLKALGYTGTQVSTVGYNVQPNYEPVANALQPKQVGYVSRNSVQVTLTQLDHVGPVIDAALARGANGVEDISFDASNTDAPRARAVAQAALAARNDAAAIATAMGGTLGQMISITTEGQPRIPMAFVARAKVSSGASAETPISPGEMTIDASVTGKWRFIAP